MTKEEIQSKWDSMTPRERDAWISKEIMNLHNESIEILLSDNDTKNHTIWDYDETIPRFTTNIKDAWEVIEETNMFAKGFCLLKNDITLGYKQIGWCIAKEEQDYLDDFVVAPTAPEAICLAALMLKESDTID